MGPLLVERIGTNKENIMLILSRKVDECIVIDDNIIVTVVEIRGGKVRLGVQVPKEVPVHRKEVFDAIHRDFSDGDSSSS